MPQYPLYSSGLELTNLVLASGLPQRSWAAINDPNPNGQPSLAPSVRVKVRPQSPTIIAIATSHTAHNLQQDRDLVSSATLKENSPIFDFLCSKTNPSFSIHRAAINHFITLHDELEVLKNQIINSPPNSPPVIITGRSIGGSIATLFTLWLLEKINPSPTKPLLCITFGSPLIGDIGLQQAILDRSWNSLFVHVVYNKDPVPRLFIDSTSQTCVYKPFGTFVLCSESGCASFEDSDSILELLVATGESPGSQDPTAVYEYGSILERLKHKVLIKGSSKLSQWEIEQPRVGILTQLEAIGITRAQQQNINTLIAKMEERGKNSKKRNVYDPSKKLNDMKINMAQLEWYKKIPEAVKIGYYDCYKNNQNPVRESNVTKYKKKLTNYWEDGVAEAKKRPRKQGEIMSTRWLYGGTNYRRMVEPLDIADYYRQGLKNYRTQGRSEHYKLLEQWQKEAETPEQRNKKNRACSLTEDSCFWADVEEAIISCQVLKDAGSSDQQKDLSRKHLVELEKNVMKLVDKVAISAEPFLDNSTFMKWWMECKEITGISHHPQFIDLMQNSYYKQYMITASAMH